MSSEEFQLLINQSQEHKVFNSDWQSFDSIDFADTLLPDAP